MSEQLSLKDSIKQGAAWIVKLMVFMVFVILALAVSFPTLKYFFPCMEGACRQIRNFLAGFLGITVANLAVYLLSKKKPPQ